MDTNPFRSYQYCKLLDIAFGNEDVPEMCILEEEATVKPKFNYLRCMEFHNMCAHIYEADRLEEFLINEGFLHTPENIENEPGVENSQNGSQESETGEMSTDQFIRNQFTTLYGPVDFENEQVKKSLNVMKEAYLECTTSTSDMELDRRSGFSSLFDTFGLELTKYIQGCGGLIYGTQCMRIKDFLKKIINKKFSHAEQSQYTNLDPSKSTGEWFVLPRLPLRKIRRAYYKKFYADNSKRRMNVNPTPLSNLHLYDPKFEFCFQMPYLFFNDGCDDEIDEIPKMVSLRMMEHLNKFPLGITMEMFWETYYNAHSKIPFLPELGSLNAIIEHHPKEIFRSGFKCKSGFPNELLFANYMEGIAQPELILKRVWHAVRHLMVEKKFIETKEIFKLIHSRYNFDFNPLHWGFESLHEFLLLCAKRFGPIELVHYRLEKIVEERVTYLEYFMLESVMLKIEIRKLNGIEEEPYTIPTKKAPEWCLGTLESIDYVSNHLSENSIELCDLKTMYDPYVMSLVRVSSCGELKDFQRDLQHDNSVKRAVKVKLEHGDLHKGMFALAHTTWGKRAEWYRVKVIQRHDNDHFEVYAIDHGFRKKVSLTDIRFIPSGYISNEKAYAIPVSLKVVHPSKKKNPTWEVFATGLMYKIVEGYYLNTTFVSSKPDETTGCPRWTVLCNLVKAKIVDGGGIFEISTKFDPNVSLSIIFYNKLQKKRIAKRNKKAKKLEESKSKIVPEPTEAVENLINQ